MSKIKETFLLVAVSLLTLTLCLGAGEVIIRLKNRSMQNYEIEMWRYAKELKVPSNDPILGHEHLTSRCAKLQNVDICLNEVGLRGGPVPPIQPGRRRILFLGASITLGWGVAQEDTVPARVEQILRKAGQPVDVMNAGIGNYNAVRYVRLFQAKLQPLQPTDIVVDYFLRDAEILERGGGNWLLRNSEFAVTLWNVVNTGKFALLSNGGIEDHYRAIYEEGSPSETAMRQSLAVLAKYAHSRGIRLYLAMIPDLHHLNHYSLQPIHEKMRRLSDELGYTYVDLLPSLAGLSPEQVWNMPGDPHPNALANLKMADAIAPVLLGTPKDSPLGRNLSSVAKPVAAHK